MFSHCQCCCGPHPANLFSANPFSSNPFSVQPVLVQPVLRPTRSRPTRSPSNPFGRQLGELRPAEPAPAAGDGRVRTGDAGVPAIRPATALRPPGGRSVPAPASAHRWRPARPPVVVIDTGIATGTLRPAALRGPRHHPQHSGRRRLPPAGQRDTRRDGDHLIDPIAGHGTFIAGIIKMIAPGCELHVQGPVSGYGDIDEHDVGLVLDVLARTAPRTTQPLVWRLRGEDMPRLAESVRGLQRSGWVVVASAGNDATCQPTYPAALPALSQSAPSGSSGRRRSPTTGRGFGRAPRGSTW